MAECPPTPVRNLWTYATCGMSRREDAVGLELHMFAPWRDLALVELLTAVAHYHRTGVRLDLGHTVNFGRPWIGNSRCSHGLISLPYLDGPPLEWFRTSGGFQVVRCLWLLPITNNELEHMRRHGIESLESLFDASDFNYIDPDRKSVVE
ncbi:suppressor of fused domain protein [Candidatus Poribacteria bacterium]|nr:suppressor of fused domain protein [Candidatus Poribacteria bacterium]